ncbi:Smr/MutS family protein [Candidatus Pelagibacter sp.]|nr:Smr/MutS family protein [Candidatus Pelagibacter sp.]
MSDKLSDKDKKDWENFLSNKEVLKDKDSLELKKKVTKTQSLDLHGFTLDEANKEIDHLIRQSYKNGTNKLIIVTGKGLHSKHEKDPYVSKDFGILRYSVPEYIKKNNELMSMIYEIKTADIEDGGSGAFYIFLKKKIIK